MIHLTTEYGWVHDLSVITMVTVRSRGTSQLTMAVTSLDKVNTERLVTVALLYHRLY